MNSVALKYWVSRLGGKVSIFRKFLDKFKYFNLQNWKSNSSSCTSRGAFRTLQIVIQLFLGPRVRKYGGG